MAIRKYIFALSVLAVAIIYDVVTSFPITSHDHGYEELTLAVNDILDQQTQELLSTTKTTLFSKDQLTLEELNEVKQTLDQLKDKAVYVKLYKDKDLLFWTDGLRTEGFCRSFIATPFTGDLCYAPFSSAGVVNPKQLAKTGYDHFYKIDHDYGQEIEGLPISIGKKYRSQNQELIILGLYLLFFLVLLGRSLSQTNVGPLLFLLSLRVIAYLTEWFDRFSVLDITNSYFSAFSYTTIDVVMDSLLLFGTIILLSSYIRSEQKMNLIELAGSAFLHMLIFISHIRLVQLIMNSDKISVNLTDLSQIKAVDVVLLSMMSLTLLSIFHHGHSLFKYYKEVSTSKRDTYIGYGVSIIVAVAISYGLQLDLDPLILMLFLISYMTLLDLFVDVKSRTITWAIWWGIFFAIYLSALLFNYDFKKDEAQRQVFLEKAFHNIPSTKIKSTKQSGLIDTIGQLISELLVLPEGSHYDQQDLTSFLKNKVQINNILIEIYNAEGQSLFGKSTLSTGKISNILPIDSLTKFDEIKNIIWYKYQLPEKQTAYIGIEEIAIAASPHNYKFNYYRNGVPIKVEQEISRQELQLVNQPDKRVIYQGADAFVVYKPSKGRLLVSKKSFLGLVKPIALFAFLFSIITISFIVLAFLNVFFKILPKDWPLTIHNIESLNSKIQISLILVILLSFIIIAAITSSFMKDYINNENQIVVKEKLENLSKDFDIRTENAVSRSETVEIISNYKKNIEAIHNINLEVSNLKNDNLSLDYFTKVFFTKQKNAFAFSYGERDKTDLSYIPIHYNKELAGIASVKLNRSAETATLNVFDFLGSIFNVYVFLFLIASVISIFIAQSITRPLSLLNQNLTEVSLSKDNKPIEWTRDDEIGILIGNYNKMVNKLKESADMLAKKERDSAWREMAKQVAHEIKNPLTPMKLSIQYLEKAIKKNPQDAIPISRRISNTMLEQIDNLTGIAEAFGNFAQLPKSSNVKVELNNVVEVVHNLFRKREDMDIKLEVPIDPIYVYADKSQLVRILNNLVKNAIEAIPNDRRGFISVRLYNRNEKAIIQVQDNGDGISEYMKDKIFQPKFTTKDSGSGLGLAISANMIDSMNGRLYFESEPGTPTSFFIELDIIRQPTFNKSKERVLLD